MSKPSLEKVGRTCHYCGRHSSTRDHIVPKILGGSNGMYNLVPSCRRCNWRKADKWPTCECVKCQTAIVYHLTGERPSLHA